MSTGWKIALWIIAGLIVLAGGVVWFGKIVWDKITFQNFKFTGADFKGITLKDIANILKSGEYKIITVSLGIEIKNENSFSIPFCNFKVNLFYKGEQIATTSKVLSESCYTIPANGVLPLEETIVIRLNQAGAKLLLDKLISKSVTVDYEVEIGALGIPSALLPTIKNSYTWNN